MCNLPMQQYPYAHTYHTHAILSIYNAIYHLLFNKYYSNHVSVDILRKFQYKSYFLKNVVLEIQIDQFVQEISGSLVS